MKPLKPEWADSNFQESTLGKTNDEIICIWFMMVLQSKKSVKDLFYIYLRKFSWDESLNKEETFI